MTVTVRTFSLIVRVPSIRSFPVSDYCAQARESVYNFQGGRFVMRRILGAIVLGSLCMLGVVARGEDMELDEIDVEAASSPVNPARPQARDDSWYYKPQQETVAPKPNPLQIVQQRAMMRGQQRDARLASMNWYGYSNSRPTAAPIAFCTPLYGPAWQSPYGAGFSWRMGQPTYIVTSRPTYLVR